MIKCFCYLCETEVAFTPDRLTNNIYRRLGGVGFQLILGSVADRSLSDYYTKTQPLVFDQSVHICGTCCAKIMTEGEAWTPPPLVTASTGSGI